MKFSFPHMGTSHVAFKYLLENLGYEVINPPTPSKKTITLGARYSPEFACMPFKVLLGTYMEVLDKGAEAIVTSGGIGPCRAGFYGVLHEKILKDMGYDFKMIILDPPLYDIKEFFNTVSLLRPKKIGWRGFINVVKDSWAKLCALDEMEKEANLVRAYEVNKGDTTKKVNEIIEVIDAASTRKEIMGLQEKSISMLHEVPQNKLRKPLKIGLIGEIYVVIEPFMNYDIERLLGEMGVIVHRSIYVTEYTRHTIWDRKAEDYIKEAAKPYLELMIGGHGVNSVGETILYAQDGYDGVIQLAPFTCIPEIVSKSILVKVSEDYGIPVLTLHIDEQTGEAGIRTRIEAFLDLLHQKRSLSGKEGMAK
ncbi:MAG: CoA protein activase [Clostridia bacterium]|nr:CoA protein activase [Clostridia bacterium]